MRTVYIVIKNGCVVDALADHLTDVVVLDYDTNDPEMVEECDKKLKELQNDRNTVECEIY